MLFSGINTLMFCLTKMELHVNGTHYETLTEILQFTMESQTLNLKVVLKLFLLPVISRVFQQYKFSC